VPRTKNSTPAVSTFSQLKQRAHKLLRGLRKDIRTKEQELSRLKQDETRLEALVGQPRIGRAAQRPSGRAAGSKAGSVRTNWSEVLAKLPKTFKASDIRKIRGLANKRGSEIVHAITRWMDADAAKRKERGVYVKV
jgi:hypothetical protein